MSSFHSAPGKRLADDGPTLRRLRRIRDVKVRPGEHRDPERAEVPCVTIRYRALTGERAVGDGAALDGDAAAEPVERQRKKCRRSPPRSTPR